MSECTDVFAQEKSGYSSSGPGPVQRKKPCWEPIFGCLHTSAASSTSVTNELVKCPVSGRVRNFHRTYCVEGFWMALPNSDLRQFDPGKQPDCQPGLPR